MKNGNTTRILKVLPVLGVIMTVLYFVLPRTGVADCVNFSCGGAGIAIQSGGCGGKGPASAQDTDNCAGNTSTPAAHMGLGGTAIVTGGASVGFGSDINGPCMNPPKTEGAEAIAVIQNNSGAKIDPIIDPSSGQVTGWNVHDAQQAGTITFQITISGLCVDHVGNSGNCVPVTFTATQSLVVDDSGCSTCNAGGNGGGGGPPPLGSASFDNNSIDFRLNLGASTTHQDGGFLRLKVGIPSSPLAQPALLSLNYQAPNVQVIASSGVIQQINTPEGLVNVNVISSYEYHLECYYAKDVGPQVSGLYTTTASPYVTYVIQNPDSASANNRLWITEQRGSTSRQFQYTYSSINYEWDLLKPDGQTLSTWMVPSATDPTITNYYRQIIYGGNVVYLDQKTYQYVSGINNTLLLQEVEGTGANTRTTTYTYYSGADAPNSASVNLLKEVVYPEGNWTYYTYDDSGRKLLEYAAFANSPLPGTGGPNPNGDDCKLTQYVYDDNYNFISMQGQRCPLNVPFQTTVNYPVQVNGSWAWQAVSRSYRWFQSNMDQVQQCTDPGAAFNDPGNLVTTTVSWTYTFPGNDVEVLLNQVTHPDGTTTYYNYPDQYTTTETDPDGSEITTETDDWGNVLLKNKVNSSITLQNDVYTYTDSSDNYLDPLRRTYNVTDLAGRTTYYSYDCCNLDSITDPDGVVTMFDYDSLKRRIASTIFYGGSTGIKTQNVLDPLGRTLVTKRFGTDGNSITNGQWQYDVLGRLVSQTNALNGITKTTYAIVNSQYVVSIIYADGGTRIETYYRDGRIQSVTGTGVHGVQYQYGAEQDPETSLWVEYTLETKLDNNGNPTSEWTKTYTDSAGRQYKTIYASAGQPNPFSESYFNEYGQLWKTVDPDGVTNFFVYGDSGDLNQSQIQYIIGAMSSTALSIPDYDTLLNTYGSLEGGSDRIKKIVRSLIPADNTTGLPNLTRTDNYAWLSGETDSEGTLISSFESSVDGLGKWTIKFADPLGAISITNSTLTCLSSPNRTSASYNPDGSRTTNSYSYGRLISSIQYDSSATPNQIRGTTYAYDPQGHQYQVTDARNGTTTYLFNPADLVTNVTTPVPAAGQLPEVTGTLYDPMLRPTIVTQPDGTSMTNTYCLTGELAMQYGTRTYPVGYTYDYAGRMQTMTTWSGFSLGTSTGPRMTTWHYDPYRGFLRSKTYDDGHGPSYTFTAAGRLATRTWARNDSSGHPIVTTYGYDDAGELASITYSDGTPGVVKSYNNLGQLSSVSVNGMTETLTYNLADLTLTESYSGGPLNGFSVTNGYDQFLRRTNLTALNSALSPVNETMYGYDVASRLSSATDLNNNSASYNYLENSPLVSQITFKQNATTRMTTTKQYDLLNRLTQISSAPSAAYTLPLTFNYNYNRANQRTKDTLVDGSYWSYGYDSLGQVTNGCKYFADGTPVAGQQFDYAFDTIGNRTQTWAGGDATGSPSSLRLASYSANNLNQITTRSTPGYVDIMGASFVANPVSVNGQTAYQKQEYYRQQISVDNSIAPVWENATVTGAGQTINGNVYVPKQPEQFSYDLDGNLISDGRWNYIWDGENRLINLTVNTTVGPQYQLTFAYDGMGRRIQKVVAFKSGSIYVPQSTLNFLYDGWNSITELSGTGSVVRNYMWGCDVSRSLQGVDGMSGILEVSYYGMATTNCFPTYDGNGNVTALVNTLGGNLAANYDYGPFGEVIRSTGPMAKTNPIRFSTEYQDDESDLVYYGHRYYKASTGTWLNRDPLNALVDFDARSGFFEDSGLSEAKAFLLADQPQLSTDYVFVNNAPIANRDILGLSCITLIASGTFTRVGEIGHKWNHTLGNHLTYTACCSCGAPSNLKLISSVPISSPPSEPFSSWVTYQWGTPTRSADNCYTYIFQVPWRAVFGLSPYQNSEAVLGNIQLQYDCCSTASYEK